MGLGSVQLPGPQVGAGKNNMNSGEGHELNGSMDTHEKEGCRRLCSIEIPACYTRSHLHLFRRMHRLLQMSKLGPGLINSRV